MDQTLPLTALYCFCFGQNDDSVPVVSTLEIQEEESPPQRRSVECAMEPELCETLASQPPRVKATFRLGAETYSLQANQGVIASEQLVSMKEQSMTILKDFITRHNVPNDVPDETEEISSEDDDGETPEKIVIKSKKQRK